MFALATPQAQSLVITVCENPPCAVGEISDFHDIVCEIAPICVTWEIDGLCMMDILDSDLTAMEYCWLEAALAIKRSTRENEPVSIEVRVKFLSSGEACKALKAASQEQFAAVVARFTVLHREIRDEGVKFT
jgi:hypothetical protein